jgi:hypothetical protein
MSLLARKFSQVKVVLNYNDMTGSMGDMDVQFPGFADLEALYWYIHVQSNELAPIGGIVLPGF